MDKDGKIRYNRKKMGGGGDFSINGKFNGGFYGK